MLTGGVLFRAASIRMSGSAGQVTQPHLLQGRQKTHFFRFTLVNVSPALQVAQIDLRVGYQYGNSALVAK